MALSPDITDNRAFHRIAVLVAMAFVAFVPRLAFPQEYFPEDTTDYYYEDEYYEGEYYEGEYDDTYYEDEYYGEEDYGEEDYYYEGEEEYYEDDTYYDEEGFDETFDEEYLEDVEPVAGEEDLELADDQAGEVELQEIEQPKVKEPRVIRGYTARVSVSSPWLVGAGFDAWWYSYIDARVALDLPRKAEAGTLAPAYTIEVGTFSFENTHPSGGLFRGVAIQAMMRFPLRPLEVAAGGGIYASGSNVRGGMFFGTSYTIPFIRFLAITLESRFTYVQDAVVSGSAYWLDVGGSIGYRF
ncbi:MAG: hypothetical protein JSW54_11845 [Fidelibacterota bacterium]|nr:MAG: hypothetical protein JSW54_11845 [Candidatus Neomarinimicrobiota bacterium]